MMEASQDLCEQDRLQLITEKRKWQTEVESRKRQLEDDRRTLQHLKVRQSKALRERWLLDGAPSAGPDQDNVKKQLEQDEATTRNLEETINRLELELLGLLCQTETQTTMSTGSNEAHKSPRMNKSRETTEEMKRVVHEVNGEDGVHLLSSSEVDELILKADEALMMSQTVSTVTSIPTVEYQEEAEPELPHISVEITGLEAKPLSEPSVADASAENPVTMVFMGYQSVEDESETKKVLGLQGTVTAELVLIDDADGKTSPGGGGMDDGDSRAKTTQHPPASAASTPLTTTRPPAATPASNRESAGEAEGRVVDLQKEKQACKCCSIM
ncbi:paralemmin 1a isoform X3 [Hippoglossus hippoglossus]|uniref:paralemmin 1a isoform X3 n=1 Tax=Hippoglossus hippoglossus TaxID=8267 RepID=UPI00148CCF26|nr:paralemmin 1a isoform X3 [Hippoglossus hippoglossus]XP_035033188.1 paralemmin 1a isoform X3 [Hippoglossus stenolepis]